jgi:hypothetical protein
MPAKRRLIRLGSRVAVLEGVKVGVEVHRRRVAVGVREGVSVLVGVKVGRRRVGVRVMVAVRVGGGGVRVRVGSGVAMVSVAVGRLRVARSVRVQAEKRAREQIKSARGRMRFISRSYITKKRPEDGLRDGNGLDTDFVLLDQRAIDELDYRP